MDIVCAIGHRRGLGAGVAGARAVDGAAPRSTGNLLLCLATWHHAGDPGHRGWTGVDELTLLSDHTTGLVADRRRRRRLVDRPALFPSMVTLAGDRSACWADHPMDVATNDRRAGRCRGRV